jgi:pyruvate dehydrogenase E1 component alpha subunit
MTYFGDGAARQGSLHEASTWLCYGNYQCFIVENNGYAMGTSVENSKPH